MISLYINNLFMYNVRKTSSLKQFKTEITERIGLIQDDYYLQSNGKILSEDHFPHLSNTCKVDLYIRTLGGKGGFGSMLRAIGAQIEKTTNREACRDLSGRRLRDINEEKRLKKWIEQQAERERDIAERKQKKLERLCEEPKIREFRDEEYDRLRSELPELIEDSITQGLKAASSKSATKRKSDDKDLKKKKKAKLWIDAELEGLDSDDVDTEGSDVENGSNSNSCDASSSTKGSISNVSDGKSSVSTRAVYGGSDDESSCSVSKDNEEKEEVKESKDEIKEGLESKE